ncbi:MULTISPECIES: MFS transporter [Burkholderia]|uniref:MFS transporter n=1 Tax=Burkholderia TaxID=32008 RepID=UPI000758AAE8|nr:MULTISPECIES: MFS transporter [Burkholderia]KVM69261.1 hypothetical protein WJ59_11775 [Burkholderia gladioli]NBI49396.1 MFS transporter [Burkholderia sp. ISTR5]
MASIDSYASESALRFYLLWLGDTTAQFGTALLSFALGVWIFQETLSVTAFGNAILSGTLPAVVMLPFSGGLCERFGRRRMIALSDCTMALLAALLLLMLHFHELRVIHLYLFNCVSSALSALRAPAYQASVAAAVSARSLVRVSGLVSMTEKLLALASPPLAGLIMELSGMKAILAINGVGLMVGCVLILRAFSRVEESRGTDLPPISTSFTDIFRNFSEALSFFRKEPLMIRLLFYSIVQTSLLTLSSTMLTPLVLLHTGARQIGIVYTCAALGGIAGASLLIALRNPKRLMKINIAADFALALCVLAISMVATTPAFCLISFFAIAAGSIAEGANSAIWLKKIPSRHKVGVLAFVRMLKIATLAAVVSGGSSFVDSHQAASSPLIDRISAVMHLSIKESGISLLFWTSGFLGLLLCGVFFLRSDTRHLDLLIPDAVEA